MTRTGVLLPLALLLFLAGCEKEHTKVVVEPRADGTFVRTISLWKTDTDKPGKTLPPDEERVERVWEFYESRLEPVGKVARFRGTFRSPPPDIPHDGRTNQGGYDVWRAGPGYVGYYRERRPGVMDLFARLEKAAAGIDHLSRILAEMFRRELEGEAGVDSLVAFLSGPFRADMKEMMFLFAGGTYDLVDDDERLFSVFAVIVQLAEERGYVAVADFPKIFNKQSVIDVLHHFIASKMERSLDDDLRGKLAFLTDSEKLPKAFEGALLSLGDSKEELEKEMEPFLKGVVSFDIFSDHETLEVVLVLPPGAEILYTSGELVPEKRRIEWEDTLDGRAVRSLYHASFAVADEAWQKAHLGSVGLTGEELYEYVFWVNGLPEEQAKAWRKAVDALEPGEGLAERLAAIRVTPRDEDEEDGREKGAKLLIAALPD
ncbi:MAG: hypothetical protein ACYTDY_03280 [Planctomycetota bacterium]|jgi:hypothetical protein